MSDAFQELLEAVDAGDDDRAEEAAQALGPSDDAVVPNLHGLSGHTDPDRRWWAARALAAIGTLAASDELVSLLQDSDPDVRACAVVGLAHLKPAGGVEPLVACLSDSSAYVARLAADALAQFGQPAVKALILALEEGDTPTRAGASRALRAVQPEEAIPALCAALDDSSAVVTHYAREALERMGVGMVFFRP